MTGGCGYVGSMLVPRLLQMDYQVKVIDTQWFGNYLPESKFLEVQKRTVESIDEELLKGVETIIHLANIANDPGVELNQVFSWEVNVLHLVQLLNKAKKSGLKRFIYASSGSVYGVKEEASVTEDLELMPISAYNKTKMVAEQVSLSYQNDFPVVCVRPATVCGYSPRMRFDVVVNMFVLQAFQRGRISVLGGDQIRPNINIEDMVSVYEHFLNNPGINGVFNAGFENISVLEIGKKIAEKFGCDLEILPSNDPRSYRQDSTKLLHTGFMPRKSVSDAIEDIWTRLKNGSLVDSQNWHTVKTMKSLGL